MYRQSGTIERWFLEKPQPPTIKITPDAYAMSMAYVDGCEKELGWLCHVSEKNGEYIIDECFLPKQEVGGATCEFTEEGISEIMTEVISKKGIDYYNQIKCWAHSHVSMSTKPSGQDKNQILKWKENDYYIMIITNKRGEFYAEFYDFKNKVAFNNLSVELYHPNQESYNRKAADEIKSAVTEMGPVVIMSPSAEREFLHSAPNPNLKMMKNPRSFNVDKTTASASCAPVIKEYRGIKLGDGMFENEEDIEDGCGVIPGSDGDWEESDYLSVSLYRFGAAACKVAKKYPNFAMMADSMLNTLFYGDKAVGVICQDLIRAMPELAEDKNLRKFIFNIAFNPATWDEEAVDFTKVVLTEELYVEEIIEALDNQEPYPESLWSELLDYETFSEVNREIIEKAMLIAPIYIAALSRAVIDNIAIEDFLKEKVEPKLWLAKDRGFLEDN